MILLEGSARLRTAQRGKHVGSIIAGDNLAALRSLETAVVDLVYLDPPFNSGADYRLEPRHGGGIAFTDVWRWDSVVQRDMEDQIRADTASGRFLSAMDVLLGRTPALAYLVAMAPRIVELHRVLKADGSLYLHCDPSASHHLRLLLDHVFGPKAFRNEITWRRQSAHGDAKGRFARVSDRILFYGRSGSSRFEPVRVPLDQDYVRRFYRHEGPDGRRYRLSDMSAPAGGGMSAINAGTGRPNGHHVWNGYAPPDRGWRYSPDTMDRLHAEGRIHCPVRMDRRPSLKRFLDENLGQAVGDVWDDLSPVTRVAAESEGYPTQKPIALLSRIIEASSRPGDLVLDPYCGSGTTLMAAQRLGRRWIGMDASEDAVRIAEVRLGRA
jgi:site-specific DNA-methyltransferase (adenine-specific)